MTQITLYPGDNRVSLRQLIAQGVRVHSVVTDAPYGLVNITKRFGGAKAAPAQFGTDGAFARASAGFMGSKWDATGIERDPEFWALIYDILLPGGYVVAFSSPKTGHWQACAMELAGFVMHPFLGWLYGQGFPKDSDAQRAIDCQVCTLPGRHYESVLPRELRPDDHICPKSIEGEAWEGWSYGGQALKPALEPIYVGQRPFSEKNGALNILKHGVGPVNIDACRAHSSDATGGEYTITRLGAGADNNKSKSWKQEGVEFTGFQKPGRHPANLLHDGSPEVVALFPGQAGAAAPVKGTEPSGVTNEIYGKFAARVPGSFHSDGGSAARFFNTFPLDVDPIRYQGKATKADRAGSKHPTVKPIALMRWLCRLVTPPGGTILEPFAGSGTTAQAARDEGFDCIIMEAEPAYIDFLRQRFSLPGPELAADDLALLYGPANDEDEELIGGAPSDLALIG